MDGIGNVIYNLPADHSCELLVFSLLLSLVTLLMFARKINTARARSPPSPTRLPFIGNVHQLTTRPHRGMHSLSQKYGPIMLFHYGHKPVYVVSSAAIAHEITRTHDASFASRPTTKVFHMLFYGAADLLFSPYGDYWRQMRKLCVNELLSSKMVQSYQYIREERVSELVTSIHSHCLNHKSAAVNLSQLLLRLSNDVLAGAVLGLSEGANEKMRESFLRAVELMGEFSFTEHIPVLGWMDHLTGFTKKLRKTAEELNTFLDQIIDSHEMMKPKLHGQGGDRSDKKDFVDIILELRKADMVGQILTKENMKAILLDMFLAGTDTSATAMEWMMAELAKNPDIMTKAQNEVRAVVGAKSKIEEADISRMEYLKCVIKETLRLHSLWLLTRQSPSTNVIVAGFEIQPNTSVLINLWAIHRDPMAWERPMEFVPERFLNTCWSDNKAGYFPFGMGRRMCPGNQFSAAQIEYAMANLLFWFDWKLPGGMDPEDLDMRDTATIVARKESPLLLVPVPHAYMLK
uniref:Cytochrome P450 n=1 Tax=Kalanchoe fedtschenkoi TaxID=63787 RepID=A0A7N0TCS3_KALFE